MVLSLAPVAPLFGWYAVRPSQPPLRLVGVGLVKDPLYFEYFGACHTGTCLTAGLHASRDVLLGDLSDLGAKLPVDGLSSSPSSAGISGATRRSPSSDTLPGHSAIAGMIRPLASCRWKK